MAGETDLTVLLASMSPVLLDQEFVFLSFKGARYGDHAELEPIAAFLESEGLTLVVSKPTADSRALAYESVYSAITLEVHSSLDAVGLTAAFATKLSDNGISANVIAAYYHDHIFVQSCDADRAIIALKQLTSL